MASRPCITIVGTGLIGASLGLALTSAKGKDVDVIGHDKDHAQARLAKKIGAVTKIERNLISACARADVLILATPIEGIRETLGYVAQDLKPGCVVTDTASIKAPVLAWADELLPPEVSFVGGDPILYGVASGAAAHGISAARPDLFADALYCIVPSSRATPDSVKLITNMASMVGAVPHFVDAHEHDGLVGATEHLADVLAATLLRTLSASGGWRDMRRLAGAAFDRVSRFTVADATEYRDRALYNRDNLRRWVEALGRELQAFAQLLAREEGDAILAYYRAGMETRERWLRDRASRDWGDLPARPEMPSSSEYFSQMLFGGLGRRQRDRS